MHGVNTDRASHTPGTSRLRLSGNLEIGPPVQNRTKARVKLRDMSVAAWNGKKQVRPKVGRCSGWRSLILKKDGKPVPASMHNSYDRSPLPAAHTCTGWVEDRLVDALRGTFLSEDLDFDFSRGLKPVARDQGEGYGLA